jgi:hypothetical protein
MTEVRWPSHVGLEELGPARPRQIRARAHHGELEEADDDGADHVEVLAAVPDVEDQPLGAQPFDHGAQGGLGLAEHAGDARKA